MKTNKTPVFLAFFLIPFALLSAGPSKENAEKQFTLFTWTDMFPQEILDGFEKETGYRINYVNFDYDETMLTRLTAAQRGITGETA